MLTYAEGTFEAPTGGRPVRWAATGRLGGVSDGDFASLNLADHVGDRLDAVQANRERVVAWAQTDGLALMAAEHGGRVRIVDEPGTDVGGDALVTARPGVALVALAADCVPIVLADARMGVIAAVHCGWRGLVAGIVPNALAAMRALGAQRVQAVIGPSICGSCYGVPAERVALVRDAVPGAQAAAACRETDQGWAIDVAGGVSAALADAGVAWTRVPGCTAERADLFSFRRDARTGRQGMIVVR